MYSLLNIIDFPEDLKKLSVSELPELATEIREFILDVVSVKAGHLGASLGVVELSIALHYHYNTPKDLLIWDVGHQAYVHKLLTGRKSEFSTLRQWQGMSGFPSRNESEFDEFGVGHSSTSISAITGMAFANQLQNKTNQHIAVIGDASIASGMAFEGLNHLGNTNLNVLIILNDNNIGIDLAVGALQNYFNQIKNSTQETFFTDLGFHYDFVENGHDINVLLSAFERLDNIHQPKLLHIKTTKGKGYEQAEKNQILWHSPGKFDKKTGEISANNPNTTFQQIVGNQLIELFKRNQKLVAITPAMPTGSGLVELMNQFPDRVWDVGIAEQHAVTLSAGLATQGMIPFCVIYSTFLQRAYDQVIHDVALQNLPVVFLIDRAGFVGSDGATHHGYFDLTFMNSIPNVTVATPMNFIELQQLMVLASETKTPFAIRYPKGEIPPIIPTENIEFGKAKKLKSGRNLAILSCGTISNSVMKATENTEVAVYHFPFVKPLDTQILEEICDQFSVILTYEDGIENGGFGASILKFSNDYNFAGRVKIHAYPNTFIDHGTVAEQEKFAGLDVESIKTEIQKFIIMVSKLT